MPNDVIADTGLFYAIFDRDDAHHARAMSMLQSTKFALLTTLAVITETAYLLKRCPPENTLNFLRWIHGGAVQIQNLEINDFERIRDVMEKYADLPADFADATLVTTAERLGIKRIATFDRHFEVYRFKNRARFTNVLMPSS